MKMLSLNHYERNLHHGRAGSRSLYSPKRLNIATLGESQADLPFVLTIIENGQCHFHRNVPLVLKPSAK